MRVVIPNGISLLDTNVAADYAEWSAATAYTTGDRVQVSTSEPHLEYEALRDNSNKAPATNPDDWLALGASNPYRMFDDRVGTLTTAENEIDVTVSVIEPDASGAWVDAVGLFGMVNVLQVTVEVYSADDVLLWAQSYPCEDYIEVGSWCEYFLAPFSPSESLVIDLPEWSRGNKLRVVLAGADGDTVSCGHLAAGYQQYLGQSLYGLDAGVASYSRKDTDEFGITSLVRRANAKTLSMVVLFDSLAKADRTHRLLTALDAVPCIWDGNDGEVDIDALRVFGFYRDFSVILADVSDVTCSLSVEGLT